MMTDIEATARSIHESIDHYARTDGYRPLEFVFAPTKNEIPTYRDESAAFVRETFEMLGLRVEIADTIIPWFDLDKDFFYTVSPKAFRDYGFAFPVTDDADIVDRFAHICDLVWRGDLIMLVNDATEDDVKAFENAGQE